MMDVYVTVDEYEVPPEIGTSQYVTPGATVPYVMFGPFSSFVAADEFREERGVVERSMAWVVTDPEEWPAPPGDPTRTAAEVLAQALDGEVGLESAIERALDLLEGDDA